jgi:hypothetical protein
MKTLLHVQLSFAGSYSPPDETTITRLVEVRPSAGKGLGLFTRSDGLPKDTPIYYWGEVIDGREHRRRYASAPGQYVMVWQALEASYRCLERGPLCHCDSGVYVDAASSHFIIYYTPVQPTQPYNVQLCRQVTYSCASKLHNFTNRLGRFLVSTKFSTRVGYDTGLQYASVHMSVHGRRYSREYGTPAECTAVHGRYNLPNPNRGRSPEQG